MGTIAKKKVKQLTRAQRTMLHNAVHGRPLTTSLTLNSIANKGTSTLQALHRAGMLAGINHQPTAAGMAYFLPPAAPSLS